MLLMLLLNLDQHVCVTAIVHCVANRAADMLSSSLESVHLSAAPILSPSMSRRLDARRSRVQGGVTGAEARTPPPVDLGDVEGLEGLGVTVNSPVSETASRMRPSATSRRVQIAKCKALRCGVSGFISLFAVVLLFGSTCGCVGTPSVTLKRPLVRSMVIHRVAKSAHHCEMCTCSTVG